MAEEQFPIFKSEGTAFDRAKIESDVSAGRTGALTGEVAESMRKAEEVSKEAGEFYTKIFKDEIKALDSAYDPSSIYYYYAYSPESSDKKKIKRSIEKGEVVDGKEIVEIAKDSASTKVRNATALKAGSVTQIVEAVGMKTLKNDMESFETVKNEFDSKIQNEDFKFEKLLDKFNDIIDFFRNPQPGQQNILYTTENNAIISALAKILSNEGFDSESVKVVSSKYEDNLNKLADKSKKGIESVTESLEQKKNEESASSVSSEQKIEKREEEKRDQEQKTESIGNQPIPQENVQKNQTVIVTEQQKIIEASEKPKESKIESALVEEKKSEANLKPESSSQSIESSIPLASKESTAPVSPTQVTGGVTNEGPEQKIIGDESSASFLKDMFGGLLSSTDSKRSEVKEGLTGLLDQMSSVKGPKPLTEELSAIESNTSSSSTLVTSAMSTEVSPTKSAQEKTPVSGIFKSLEKIQEKSGSSPETLSKIGGIKETVTQKLSSPLQVETKANEEKNTNQQSVAQEVTSTEVKTESMSSSEASEKVGESSNRVSQTSSSEETKGDKGNEDLSSKMETMISLLSQLNDTLSGPLLVTSTTKKFE